MLTSRLKVLSSHSTNILSKTLKKLVSPFHLNIFTTEEKTSSSCHLWLCQSHSTLQSQTKCCVTKTDCAPECVTRISSRHHRVLLLSSRKDRRRHAISMVEFSTPRNIPKTDFFSGLFLLTKIMISRASLKKKYNLQRVECGEKLKRDVIKDPVTKESTRQLRNCALVLSRALRAMHDSSFWQPFGASLSGCGLFDAYSYKICFRTH